MAHIPKAYLFVGGPADGHRITLNARMSVVRIPMATEDHRFEWSPPPFEIAEYRHQVFDVLGRPIEFYVIASMPLADALEALLRCYKPDAVYDDAAPLPPKYRTTRGQALEAAAAFSKFQLYPKSPCQAPPPPPVPRVEAPGLPRIGDKWPGDAEPEADAPAIVPAWAK